jgi:hypothetical protein
MRVFGIMVAAVFVLGITVTSSAQDPGMMSSGPGKKTQRSADETAGARIFNPDCLLGRKF